MLGAAHALANPLTAFLDVPHGQAVGIMMPHVVRFNAPEVDARYRELVHLLPETTASDLRNPSESLALRFQSWLSLASLACRLCDLPAWSKKSSEYPSPDDLIDAMAQMASKQWTGAFNPRPATQPDFAKLYREANR